MPFFFPAASNDSRHLLETSAVAVRSYSPTLCRTSDAPGATWPLGPKERRFYPRRFRPRFISEKSR